MKRAQVLSLLIFFILAGHLTGCLFKPAIPGQTIESPIGTIPVEFVLNGSEWIMLEMQGRPLVEGTHITLGFWQDGAGGTAGCNSYGGRYAVNGSLLQFAELSNTAMDCGGGSVMEQEAEYLRLLHKTAVENAVTFAIVEGSTGVRLELRDAFGMPLLVYGKKEALAMDPKQIIGTAWRLADWEHDQVVSNPLPVSNPTLIFLNENEIVGFAGCRHYYSRYQASGGDDIRVTFTAMTGPDCHTDEALTLRESQFTDLLAVATDFYIDEGKTRLDLLTIQGAQASFLRLNPLDAAEMDGTEWRLAAYFEEPANGQNSIRIPIEPLGDRPVTLQMSQGRASGSTGCNRYMASYVRKENRLTITSPGATKMFCGEPPGLMAQEQRYLETLTQIETYIFLPGQLWLTTGDEQALWFTSP